MIKYNLVENELGSYVERFNEDGTITSIPIDPANSDYQRYLNPEAEQSTPILPPAQDKPISFTAGKTCYNDTLRSDHGRD